MVKVDFGNLVQLGSSISALLKGNEISIMLGIINVLHKLYDFLKIFKWNNTKPKRMSRIEHTIVINGSVNIYYNVILNKK